MSTDIVTRSCDFARTGANTTETVLTPAAVHTRGVKVVLTLSTPDDPRLEAQPLYVSDLDIGGKRRNVIFQATMGNVIYAWDADTGQKLWETILGTPIDGKKAVNAKGQNQIDAHNINVKWGILSTPVVDRAAGVLYACAWISPNHSGDFQTGEHFLAAVDLATGALKQGKPLLSLEGTTFDPSHGLAPIRFKSLERKQRSALALVSGAVVICFGTIQETASSARGWVIAVDTSKWVVSAAWCSTAKGSGGGIWMSGAGPAIQSDGSIWVVTGNGAFDGQVDFGESVVRLRYTAPSGNHVGSLAVAGWWTPWTDDGRIGKNPVGESGTPAVRAMLKDLPRASNFRPVAHLARLGVQAKDMGAAWGDQDLGASGIVLLERFGVALVSGKDGILYTISLNHTGDTAPADLGPAHVAVNYAKLAVEPILYTYFDPAINPHPSDPSTLNQLSGNRTHHLHGTPVAWTSTAHGQMHFCGGENGNLRAWSLNKDKSSTFLGCSAAVASADAPVPSGGMPGWSIFLSANGTSDAIVWAMIPLGDANMTLTKGRLLAYDAANLATFADGSGEIVALWDSQEWNWDFLHPKFNRPVVADGKVLVPTYDGRILVLGLA